MLVGVFPRLRKDHAGSLTRLHFQLRKSQPVCCPVARHRRVFRLRLPGALQLDPKGRQPLDELSLPAFGRSRIGKTNRMGPFVRIGASRSTGRARHMTIRPRAWPQRCRRSMIKMSDGRLEPLARRSVLTQAADQAATAVPRQLLQYTGTGGRTVRRDDIWPFNNDHIGPTAMSRFCRSTAAM